MDKRIEILNQRNCGPQIAQEVRNHSEYKKNQNQKQYKASIKTATVVTTIATLTAKCICHKRKPP
jgi:hypothetical protein